MTLRYWSQYWPPVCVKTCNIDLPPRTIFSVSHIFRTFCRMLNVFVMVHKLWVHFLAVQCIAERGRICYNLWY